MSAVCLFRHAGPIGDTIDGGIYRDITGGIRDSTARNPWLTSLTNVPQILHFRPPCLCEF